MYYEKKIFFSVFAAIMIFAAAAYNVTISSEIEGVFNISLANSEALAQGEGSGNHAPCETKQVTENTFFDHSCGSLKIKEYSSSYTCINFGPGTCSIGYIYIEYACSGSIKYQEGSETNWSSTCIF